MYSVHWFACRCSGGDIADTIEEAKAKYEFAKKIFGAHYCEIRNRATNELVLKIS